MDVGSRRLVARNRFRNTINAFTGLNATWAGESGAAARAFFVVPVRRLPNETDELGNETIQFDEEQWGTRFLGLDGTLPLLDGALEGEAYVLGLDENDEGEVRTRDRQLLTFGARLLKEPAAGAAHFEWESALQVGQSRGSTSPSDTTDLDHLAQLHHLTLGYRFEGAWEPTVEGLFDYASGDRDPNDGDNERFDTLYGARRFEFGPTGILGALARSNLISPGLRLWLRPTKRTRVLLSFRQNYLASKKDAWVPSGLVDPTGNSGREIGQFAELALRHDLVPKSVQLEAGVAQLWGGEFVQKTNTAGPDDSLYGYASVTLSF